MEDEVLGLMEAKLVLQLRSISSSKGWTFSFLSTVNFIAITIINRRELAGLAFKAVI